MVVVDVDVVGPEPLERGVEAAPDEVARARRRRPAAAEAELRREHDFRSPSREHLAEEALAVAVAVDVGRVEERDALGQRGLDDCARSFEVEPPPEVVAPEADARDLDAARTELLQAHASLLPIR